ncbi:MauE/DoxX family redox-associated membrane protein [Compostibacter hankyongensis]
MKKAILIQAIAAVLILLLVYAAVSKLLDHHLFVAQLHTHPYLKPMAGFISWAVPLSELAVSGLLMLRSTQYAGLWCAAGLLTVFTVYLSMMLLSGKDLPCSCGGIISGLSWRQHLLFNLFFIILAGIGIGLMRKRDARLEIAGYASDLPAIK